mgnify:CR=1 FL=1
MKTKNLKISAVCALSAAALTCMKFSRLVKTTAAMLSLAVALGCTACALGWKPASAETVPTYETLCADYNGASTEAFFALRAVGRTPARHCVKIA